MAFTLTFPGRASRGYLARVKAFRGKKVPVEGVYGYGFGNGWVASIEVKTVTKEDARKIRAASDGFLGYEWMIDSIIRDGAIYGPSQPKPV